MVSSEGACAAYYQYRRLDVPGTSTVDAATSGGVIDAVRLLSTAPIPVTMPARRG